MTAKTLIRVWRVSLPDGTDSSIWGMIYAHTFQPIFTNYLGSLVMAVVYVLIWLGIMSLFYRKRIFFKI
jgi:predicted acyltransferase